MPANVTTTVSNKQLMLQCYDEFFNKRNLAMAIDLIHEDFIQHSPDAPSGRDAYIEHLKEAAFGHSKIEIKRVIADEDYVVVHYRMSPPDGPALAVVDIWRFADGKIVEHWDVEQPLPEASSTPNGML
jgi:predicted SnoaL-like aldol condensation-catalyzing enzyme